MNLSALDPLVLAGLGAVVAYFIGSLSFAVIVSRFFGLADPRSYGSGNPGPPTCCVPATRRRPS